MQSNKIAPIHPSDHNMMTNLKKLDNELENETKYNILNLDCCGYAEENEYDESHKYSLYSYIYEETNTIHRREQLCNAVTLIPLTHVMTPSPKTTNAIEPCRYDDTVMGKSVFENSKCVTGATIDQFNPKSKSLVRRMPPEWKEEVFTRYECGGMTRNLVGIAYLILGVKFSLVRGLYPTVLGSRSRIIFAMDRRKGLTKKDFVEHFERTAEFKNSD